jgi:hypothetical protein
LRFYAGGFHFDDPTGVAQAVTGPRLRLESTHYQVPGLWNVTRFTVSGEWQTDDVRGNQFFAGLRLRVALQAEPRRSNFTLQERRMTDTITRDVDIVANTQTVQIAPAIHAVVGFGITNAGWAAVPIGKRRTCGKSNGSQDSNYQNFRYTVESRVMTGFWARRDYWPISSVNLRIAQSLAALER